MWSKTFKSALMVLALIQCGCFVTTTESSVHEKYKDLLSKELLLKDAIVRVYKLENYYFSHKKDKKHLIRIYPNQGLYDEVHQVLKDSLDEITIVQPGYESQEEFDELSPDTINAFVNKNFPSNKMNREVVDIFEYSDEAGGHQVALYIIPMFAMTALYIGSLGLIPFWVPLNQKINIKTFSSNGEVLSAGFESNEASGWLWTPNVFDSSSYSIFSVSQKSHEGLMPDQILTRETIKVCLQKNLDIKKINKQELRNANEK